MDEYVALVRIRPATDSATLPGMAAAATACRTGMAGVSHALVDSGQHSLHVRFDRGRASIADIVRFIEDLGLTVTAVAQSKADARLHAASA
jgi:hypothetical protein